LHQVGDLFELNVKLRCEKLKKTEFRFWRSAYAWCQSGSCAHFF